MNLNIWKVLWKVAELSSKLHAESGSQRPPDSYNHISQSKVFKWMNDGELSTCWQALCARPGARPHTCYVSRMQVPMSLCSWRYPLMECFFCGAYRIILQRAKLLSLFTSPQRPTVKKKLWYRSLLPVQPKQVGKGKDQAHNSMITPSSCQVCQLLMALDITHSCAWIGNVLRVPELKGTNSTREPRVQFFTLPRWRGSSWPGAPPPCKPSYGGSPGTIK